MRLKIDKNDLDAFRYVCTNHDLRYSYIPDKPGVVEISIRHKNGAELSSEFAFCVGREVEARREFDLSCKRIEESEAMRNNVVVLVEPIEDLP